MHTLNDRCDPIKSNSTWPFFPARKLEANSRIQMLYVSLRIKLCASTVCWFYFPRAVTVGWCLSCLLRVSALKTQCLQWFTENCNIVLESESRQVWYIQPEQSMWEENWRKKHWKQREKKCKAARAKKRYNNTKTVGFGCLLYARLSMSVFCM